MGKSWSDREALELTEPQPAEEGSCPLCGVRVGHPFEPGGTVLCHPDRGGCGAVVRPVPYLGGDVELPHDPAARGWASCCHPYVPVGTKVVHSRWCPLYADQGLGQLELLEWREENRARQDHPAGTGRDVPPLMRLVDDPAYLEAHLDDDDDR